MTLNLKCVYRFHPKHYYTFKKTRLDNLDTILEYFCHFGILVPSSDSFEVLIIKSNKQGDFVCRTIFCLLRQFDMRDG